MDPVLIPGLKRYTRIMKPNEGEETVLRIIEDFIRQHNVHEVRRAWQFSKYSTIQFELRSSVDLRVASYFRELIIVENGELKPIETIRIAVSHGNKTIDEVEVHIDLSSVEGFSIDRIWDLVMGPSGRFGLEKALCLENEIWFDVRMRNSEVSEVEPAGVEIYTMRACSREERVG